MNGPIDKLYFKVNPEANDGESVVIETIFFKDGKDKPFINTEISIQSYGNSATFTLSGASLSPAILRDLANKIDEKMSKLSAL